MHELSKFRWLINIITKTAGLQSSAGMEGQKLIAQAASEVPEKQQLNAKYENDKDDSIPATCFPRCKDEKECDKFCHPCCRKKKCIKGKCFCECWGLKMMGFNVVWGVFYCINNILDLTNLFFSQFD